MASLVRHQGLPLSEPMAFGLSSALSFAYLPFIRGEGCGQFFNDPVFRSRLAKSPEDLLTAAATMLASFPNLALTWDDLDWLRAQTTLPLLVKGVLTADDARQAQAHGVDGIVVSNHGGRQVDGAVASLDALVEVREAVGPDYPLLVDGGIRRGSDVVKALALGARAVMIGRAYLWGLAADGQAGVENVLDILRMGIDSALLGLGRASIHDLSPTGMSASNSAHCPSRGNAHCNSRFSDRLIKGVSSRSKKPASSPTTAAGSSPPTRPRSAGSCAPAMSRSAT